MILRDYQKDAVDSVFNYFENKNGNPIVTIPTGGGKTIVIAEFIRRTVEAWPREKFLLLSHVKELLEQNATTLKKLAPSLDVGIFSAGLRQKKLGSQVTIAGIQSIYRRAHEAGDVSIIIVDECHLIGKHADGMYQRFFADLKRYCPHVKIVGFSATPFRLDSGPLHKGSKAIFSDIVYNITIRELIEQGFLCRLASAGGLKKVNTDNVKKRGGEFISEELALAVDKEEVTGPALDKVGELCGDRQSLLFFCVSVEHAKHINDSLKNRGYSCAVILGDTPSDERSEAIELFRSKKIKAIASVGVLTTGFDAPNVDAIICLRPTMSPGLWIQMVGRGSRLCGGKKDCLILDFTGNTRTHGPVDMIEVDGDGELKTSPTEECPQCKKETPKKHPACKYCEYIFTKTCPSCLSAVRRDLKECFDCGFVWETVARGIKHNKNPSKADIISNGGVIEETVLEWHFSRHKKTGSPDSLKVTYVIDMTTQYSEWICLEHDGYARIKAVRWWERHSHGETCPGLVTEALDESKKLNMPKTIRVKKEGKYWRVIH